ncbi:MAG: hypothetical protein COW30_01780 [Rhodospirillales bacterium CG15_BIG_FIL_POST_REV_8_21_14_020_66_15]|nr:MAG: hypothetical protein COW30_01780 [Rhodospirillales bacterium CG15_BIG_FIL_POST_REV_8_21_14_020_66_15]
MTKPARIGGLLALAALIAAGTLWWGSGAWQLGDLPTRGFLRVTAFALGALACHGVAAWLRRRGR